MDGFESYYRPDSATIRDALGMGMVAFDTNALLDLYRFSPQSRAEYLSSISLVSERIFIPHQVMKEFHGRRPSAVEDNVRQFEEARKKIEKYRLDISDLFKHLSRRTQGASTNTEETASLVDRCFDDLETELDRIGDEYDLDPDDMATMPDEILAKLSETVRCAVGERPASEQLEIDLAEARRRSENRIPPGFSDQGKTDNQYGDYLLWAEICRRAERTRPKFVVLISNETSKSDWVKKTRGFVVGPLPELCEEVEGLCGARFMMITTVKFLEEISSTDDRFRVSDSTLAEARGYQLERALSLPEETSSSFVSPDASAWREEAAEALMTLEDATNEVRVAERLCDRYLSEVDDLQAQLAMARVDAKKGGDRERYFDAQRRLDRAELLLEIAWEELAVKRATLQEFKLKL